MSSAYRMGDQQNQLPQHAKTLLDRQQRSSFNDAPNRFNAYHNQEDEGFMTARSEGPDPYGDREIQGFGQQLFSNRDNGIAGLNAGGYAHPQDPSMRYRDGSPVSPQGSQGSMNSSINSHIKTFPSAGSRSPHSNSMQPGLSLHNISPRGHPDTSSQNFSPGSSPRSPHMGYNRNVGPNSPHNYNYPPSLGQQLHLGQSLGQGQIDTREQRLSFNNDDHSPRSFPQRLNNMANNAINVAGVSPRNNYLTTANHASHISNPALFAQKNQNQTQLQSQNQALNQAQNPQIQGQSLVQNQALQNQNKYNFATGTQYSLALPSPRTTSFMPFGSTSNRALPDYSQSDHGTDYPLQDDLITFGEFNATEYASEYNNAYNKNEFNIGKDRTFSNEHSEYDYNKEYKEFRNEYTPSMLDSLHMYPLDGLVEPLESTHAYRQGIQTVQKSWDGI